MEKRAPISGVALAERVRVGMLTLLANCLVLANQRG